VYVPPPHPPPLPTRPAGRGNWSGGQAGGPAAGTVYQEVQLINRSDRSCMLSGGPEAVTGVRVAGGTPVEISGSGEAVPAGWVELQQLGQADVVA
jgi:hypothetical protein